MLKLLKGDKRLLAEALRRAERPTLLITGRPEYVESLDELEDVYLCVVKDPLSFDAPSAKLEGVREVLLDATPFLEAQGHLRRQLDWLIGYVKAAGARLTVFCPLRYDPKLKREAAAVKWLERLGG